ncbi:hypothetical protein [Streptomyces sp. enrichment culture]|uniref:hypothetical protein n=1 Tax=Streptomyces sp. enrichment culture TaxID=1795815 RepID=UPI003F556C23
MNEMGATVCVRSPDSSGIWRYNGQGTSWTQIRGPSEAIASGDWGLIARTFGHAYEYYDGTPNQWNALGGPRGGATVGGDTVFAQSQEGDPIFNGVYQFDGYVNDQPSWSRIGDPMWSISAGGWGLCAEVSIQGNLVSYTGNPGEWEVISGPVHKYLVAQDTVYRWDFNKVFWQYNGNGTSWTKISGPMHGNMSAGGWGLVAGDFDANSLRRYLGAPGQWERLGDYSAQFTVTDNTVYRVPFNSTAVQRYGGTENTWIPVGGPGSSAIVATD